VERTIDAQNLNNNALQHDFNLKKIQNKIYNSYLPVVDVTRIGRHLADDTEGLRAVGLDLDNTLFQHVLDVDEAIGEIGVATEAVLRIELVEAVLGVDGVVYLGGVHADFVANNVGQSGVVQLRVLEDQRRPEGLLVNELQTQADRFLFATETNKLVQFHTTHGIVTEQENLCEKSQLLIETREIDGLDRQSGEKLVKSEHK